MEFQNLIYLIYFLKKYNTIRVDNDNKSESCCRSAFNNWDYKYSFSMIKSR